MQHSITSFTHLPIHPSTHPPSYHYTGHCPLTGKVLQLPRTELVESIAQGLMRQLGNQPEFQEGKIYGVLLVEKQTGEQAVLKAFSGLLNGESTIAGWVPPAPGRDQVALAEVSH